MDNNETQADIIREMRTYFQAKKRGNPEHRPWHQVLSDWADRIEAAEREMAKGMSKKLDGNRSIPGNVAAMREALDKIHLIATTNINECLGDESDIHIVNLANAALAAPPRNCDRPFKTLAEFQRYYSEHGCKKGLGVVVDGEITKVPWKSNFEEWLFAPEIERKGEADGSK